MKRVESEDILLFRWRMRFFSKFLVIFYSAKKMIEPQKLPLRQK